MSSKTPTNTAREKGLAFWLLQIPGWILLLWLIIAQGVSAFSYELGVSMGSQEPAASITEVGAAFWYGFAFGDLIIYIPLLATGLVAHWRASRLSPVVLGGALGITIYWPIVCLAALVDARGAPGWQIASEISYWIVCLLVAAWGTLGLWLLAIQTRRQAK